MMLREMFLLALEKYLDSLSDTCIIAADVYMSLSYTFIHQSSTGNAEV